MKNYITSIYGALFHFSEYLSGISSGDSLHLDIWFIGQQMKRHPLTGNAQLVGYFIITSKIAAKLLLSFYQKQMQNIIFSTQEWALI